MPRKILLASIALMGMLVVYPVVAQATIIQPTAATASTDNGGVRPANATRNGSGLSFALATGDPIPVVFPNHDTDANGMWAASPGDAAPFITFDLGAVYSIDGFHSWNFNQPGFSSVGARGVNVSFSTTSAILGFGIPEAFVGVNQLTIAPEASYPGEDRFFATTHIARWVRFDVLTNQGNTTYLGGLSEVRFFQQVPVPEPTTLSLLGAGLLGMACFRRHQRRSQCRVDCHATILTSSRFQTDFPPYVWSTKRSFVMSRHIALAALFCVLSSAAPAWSVTITVDYGTLPVLSGGQVSGPSFPTTPMGSNPGIQNYNLTAAGNYFLDFFQYGGANSNDFFFTFNGTNITSVSTNSNNSGPYTMVDGFISGATTLTLNTNAVVYNANTGQKGSYFAGGSIPAQGTNSPPITYTAIPGLQPVDNLYNAGGGNEDYSYLVDTNGNTLAAPGPGGGPTGIPNSEYATFSGNQVNPRSELVHIVLDTNVAMGGIAPTHPITNHVITMGGTHQEFDIRMPIGASGINFSAFGIYAVTSSDAVTPNNTPYTGITGTNDFLFFPTLRFDGLSNGSGYYWQGPGPGIDNTVTAVVSGFFDGNVTPLNLTVTAFLPEFVYPIPEPSTLALLGLGAVGLAIRTRRRRAAA